MSDVVQPHLINQMYNLKFKICPPKIRNNFIFNFSWMIFSTSKNLTKTTEKPENCIERARPFVNFHLRDEASRTETPHQQAKYALAGWHVDRLTG